MKRKILSVLFPFILLSLLLSSPEAFSRINTVFARNGAPLPQESPVKKPQYDYMSTFLARNTKPLGLKIDLSVQKLLKQSTIKWAFRSEERHILE